MTVDPLPLPAVAKLCWSIEPTRYKLFPLLIMDTKRILRSVNCYHTCIYGYKQSFFYRGRQYKFKNNNTYHYSIIVFMYVCMKDKRVYYLFVAKYIIFFLFTFNLINSSRKDAVYSVSGHCKNADYSVLVISELHCKGRFFKLQLCIGKKS
jgi:hypothetical protein